MLYDKRWERTKTIPFTLADFIAWLETKDPEGRYDFHNCHGQCLMGQYMEHHGREWGNYWESCAEIFGDPSDVPVLGLAPLTYGGALERARELANKSCLSG